MKRRTPRSTPFPYTTLFRSVNGTQRSVALPTTSPKNSGGVMPMTVSGCPFKVSCLPSADGSPPKRSEEHTSELQSQSNLVCRLLLEKTNNSIKIQYIF